MLTFLVRSRCESRFLCTNQWAPSACLCDVHATPCMESIFEPTRRLVCAARSWPSKPADLEVCYVSQHSTERVPDRSRSSSVPALSQRGGADQALQGHWRGQRS